MEIQLTQNLTQTFNPLNEAINYRGYMSDFSFFANQEPNESGRICFRVFVSQDKIWEACIEAEKYEFRREIVKYSPHIKNGARQDGYYLQLSKNGKDRQISPDSRYREILNYYPSETSSHQANLLTTFNQDQIRQISELWSKYFGTHWTEKEIEKTLRETNIVALENKGQILAVCMIDDNNYGNLEITEVATGGLAGIGSQLIREVVNFLKQKYPDHRYFLEANMSSGMPESAIKSGFHSLTTDETSNGEIIGNVIVDLTKEWIYRNFIYLFYPINQNIFTKI